MVLVVPLTEATRGLVDAEFLARMKDGALLVNVARGAVVVTDDLVAALHSGRISAATDVTEVEPLPADHAAVVGAEPADLAARGRVVERHVAAGPPAGPRAADPVRRGRAPGQRDGRRLLSVTGADREPETRRAETVAGRHIWSYSEEMTIPPELATANLADVAPGTHLCAFYDSDEQLARIASTFVARGLAAGDRLLYIAADDDAATSMLGSLLGEDPSCHALASGQLHIQSFGDAYGDVHDRRPRPDRGRLPGGRGAGPEERLPRPAGGCRDGRLRPLPRVVRGGAPLGAALDGDAARPRRDLGLPVRPASPRGRRRRPARRRARGAGPGPRRPADRRRSSPSASPGASRSRARWTSPTARP